MPAEEASKPTPDPTVLTTEQLLREVDRVKELMQAELTGLERIFEERFHSVETQFGLIERQRVEQKSDTEKAVQAALSAAKEAVKEQTAAGDKSILKSETSTADQLRQLTVTFTTAIAGLSSIMDDLKTRLERLENARQGGSEGAAAGAVQRSQTIAVVSVLVAVIGVVVILAVAFLAP